MRVRIQRWPTRSFLVVYVLLLVGAYFLVTWAGDNEGHVTPQPAPTSPHACIAPQCHIVYGPTP